MAGGILGTIGGYQMMAFGAAAGGFAGYRTAG